MIKRTLLLLSMLASMTAQAEILAAPAAEAALAQGALAWDVREQAAAGLPGALKVDGARLDAWLQSHDLAALREAVSAAGLDLSRDIVVYGEAGDARAQALVESLQALSPGRVHWLVGGATEWAMSGRELKPLAAARLPVPQWLVAPVAEGPKQMAGAALRTPTGDGLLLQTAAR
ncbi:rhodanese-like domain-containing protein [Pelomonas sp. KK5]|uniref:rhodanese-like domain-containing protein n=1 Tax=Pelomonas sp. KK5 TaxID=1855730 RepID=UPI00097CA083|nr:rhodanese-like domain-containing protein [Pelomonas sp. KK5]